MKQKKHTFMALLLATTLTACLGTHSKSAKTTEVNQDLSAYKNENSYFYFLLDQLQGPENTHKELANFLDEALKRDDGSNFLWNLKAYSEAESGRMDEAQASALKALQNNPQSSETLFLLAKIASFEKKTLQAQKYLDQAIRGDDPQDEMYNFLAREYYNAKDYDMTERTLKQCVQKISESTDCLYYLGSLQLEEGQENEAIQTFTTLSQWQPDQVKILQVLGEIYIKRENFSEALEVYKKIFKLTPEDVAVQVRLGWLYYQIGDKDYAREVFERIQRRYPQADKVNYFLALLYLEDNKLDEALLAFSRIPANSTFFKKSATQQLAILSEKNQVDQFANHMKSHLIESEDSWFYLFLSWQEIQNEKFTSAIDILNEGIRRFGEEEDLLFQRALAFERSNKWDESKKDLNVLMTQYPESAKAYNFLGYSMAERGEDLDQALEFVNKANQLEPNKAHILDSLGWIYFKKNQNEQSLEYLFSALKLQKDEPTILEHLGDVYRALQDNKTALNYYKQSIDVLESMDPFQAVHHRQKESVNKKILAITHEEPTK